MGEAAKVFETVLRRMPGLQPFLNLLELNQADITTSGVLGFYDTLARNVVIGNRALNWTGSGDHVVVPTFAGVVAHEIGHALSYHSQPGFRPVEQALQIARMRYNKGRTQKLGEGSFARTISAYAATGPHEAFAEAFADWTINGMRAKSASLHIINQWRNR